jgi:hypothetical protein
MFKRFIDVYGKEFQPLLGDKQYISDPFWDRVIPRKTKLNFSESNERDIGTRREHLG